MGRNMVEKDPPALKNLSEKSQNFTVCILEIMRKYEDAAKF